ncbi:MAG: hypothetical protein QOG68_399 [Solirubrobacteraceae bacterium]|nr:hypothetical protein [Solirubrobacteraceae bacterium]
MRADGSNERRSPRLVVEVQVALRRERGNVLVVRTVDLGAAGMRVVSERPLAVDEVLQFDFDLPAPPPCHLGGRARVVREHGPRTYGMRLEGLDERATSDLTRFVTATDRGAPSPRAAP